MKPIHNWALVVKKARKVLNDDRWWSVSKWHCSGNDGSCWPSISSIGNGLPESVILLMQSLSSYCQRLPWLFWPPLKVLPLCAEPSLQPWYLQWKKKNTFSLAFYNLKTKTLPSARHTLVASLCWHTCQKRDTTSRPEAQQHTPLGFQGNLGGRLAVFLISSRVSCG